MLKIEAIAKACQLEYTNYIYNMDYQEAFLTLGNPLGEYHTGSFVTFIDTNDTHQRDRCSGALNYKLLSLGWEINRCDLLGFTPENMPWNKKISIKDFIRKGDILQDLFGDRFLIQSCTKDCLYIRHLKTGEIRPSSLNDPSSLEGVKVLITCDGRSIPEHLATDLFNLS